MTALVQTFFDVLAIMWTFVMGYMVPETSSDVTILHIAIWLPVIMGLITLTVATVRSLWGRGGRSRR